MVNTYTFVGFNICLFFSTVAKHSFQIMFQDYQYVWQNLQIQNIYKNKDFGTGVMGYSMLYERDYPVSPRVLSLVEKTSKR